MKWFLPLKEGRELKEEGRGERRWKEKGGEGKGGILLQCLKGGIDYLLTVYLLINLQCPAHRK